MRGDGCKCGIAAWMARTKDGKREGRPSCGGDAADEERNDEKLQAVVKHGEAVGYGSDGKAPYDDANGGGKA